MTPNEARKSQNEVKVKANLNKHVVYKRSYPEIKIGAIVIIYKKQDKLDKQQVSVWSKSKYAIEETIRKNDQHFTKLRGITVAYY